MQARSIRKANAKPHSSPEPPPESGSILPVSCAAANFDLILVARSTDKLQALARELEAEHEIHAHVIKPSQSFYGGHNLHIERQ